jgi:hypothetical protein
MRQKNFDLTCCGAGNAIGKHLQRLRGIFTTVRSLGLAFLCATLVSYPIPPAHAGTTCVDFSGFKKGETMLPDFSVGSFQFHHIDGHQLSSVSSDPTVNALHVNSYGLEIRLPDKTTEVHMSASSGFGTFLVIGHNGTQVVSQYTVYKGNKGPFQDYKMTAQLIARLIIVGGSGEAAISSICATSP